ncbi:Protein-export membrane protein SecG [bacterium HR40]|nr:Protein-export membrane protein SecG [bacterium HR40]
MVTVVLVIHLLIAIALVAVILVQRSEGGGLGIGGGSMGGLMTTRGTANLLTRTTAILATAFIGTSLLLAILAGNANRAREILERVPATAPAAPATAPQGGEAGKPQAPVAD